MKIDFFLRFTTRFGQQLAITGSVPQLGSNDLRQAVPMTYYNADFWTFSLELDPEEVTSLQYRYLFTDVDGSLSRDGETDRTLTLDAGSTDLLVVDTWNYSGAFENAFFTAPFQEVFLSAPKSVKSKKLDGITHIFKVKAPLLQPGQSVCLLGDTAELGAWDAAQPVHLSRVRDWWTLGVNLSKATFPVTYKYGVYDGKAESFVRFETGANRTVEAGLSAAPATILHDGFVRLPDAAWKGAGVAIPVFSLKSSNSFGVGEFTDIKLLVDWAAATGLKLIQLLPVNDTMASFSWKDSYPYAAISTFALHPIYLNLQKVAGKKQAPLIKALAKKQKQLNGLTEVDYEKVLQFKLGVLRELYEIQGTDFLKEKEFEAFFAENRHWLVDYAAFSTLRDRNGTANFDQWKTHSVYREEEVKKLTSPRSKGYKEIVFYYFLQYHLHLQLQEAADYAHKKGIALKGDIPIGVYRYGCDAWTHPSMYRMDLQAGAPPDPFAVKGQNWGFPIYNWKRMQEDGFAWWRLRFQQMSRYFDAFRIDHILGFFRIWAIPVDQVEGVMGVFVPALPLTRASFEERGIAFDELRFCQPYITEETLHAEFGERADEVKQTFLEPNDRGGYNLKEDFATQRKVAQHFEGREGVDDTAVKQGLFNLIANVLLFAEPDGDGFHFRISVEETSSFQHLDAASRRAVKDLYIDYFYYRQDTFWKKEALSKLPALKEATHMLICGEDLGMVPHCVPDVMRDLGILSLEIQRMPKNPHTEFFHPKDAPYLSVITPSTHDMSTIRGWWEEDRDRTQRFFQQMLGESGAAPETCASWINRAIVLQHLHAPAMWSIFQLQDLLGMSDTLRRDRPQEERINDPANSTYYWNYRMHLTLEQLLKEKEFNNELKDYIHTSGRS